MIVFGKNVAKEVIDSKKEIKKVYLANNFDDKKLIKYFEDNNIKINKMDKRILDQKKHQSYLQTPEIFYY